MMFKLRDLLRNIVQEHLSLHELRYKNLMRTAAAGILQNSVSKNPNKTWWHQFIKSPDLTTLAKFCCQNIVTCSDPVVTLLCKVSLSFFFFFFF